MDFIDYAVCIVIACIIEAMLCQLHYVFSARKLYKIMDAYRLAPDNDIVAADYKKLTNNIFNPVIAFVRVICYVFGCTALMSFVVGCYKLLGI